LAGPRVENEAGHRTQFCFRVKRFPWLRLFQSPFCFFTAHMNLLCSLKND
jgi:hypothetical protein